MATATGGTDDPSPWLAAIALVEELLALPEDQRTQALDAAAPSVEVRHLVERLMDADRRGSILDAPLEALAPGEHTAQQLTGRRVGRWLLTGLLGQGGMSVVCRARSLAPPIGQESAVKLLSMAAATEGGRARFEREIQILIRLQHPAIAPIIDAGVADDGTPWFAMALVDGVDIATWCREQGLDARQRVDLLLQVCDAVAHAHRHLVIHRDIKPSNVLVDAEGRAILLDFGISRILEDGASEVTGTGLYAFTPRYAAPEQIDGGTITTATDVYSLGSLLHLLLLGTAPRFPPNAPDAECVDPGTLSRRGEDAGLHKALAGDLGAILCKSLARRPGNRYPGAAEFAADLRAWRTGRPVSARKNSSVYRFRRFIGRHRLAASMAATLLVALVAGTWVSLAQREAALASAEQAAASEASARRQLEFLQGLLLALSPSRDAPALIHRDDLLEQAEERARRELAEEPRALAEVLVALSTVHGQAGQDEAFLALLEDANLISPPSGDDVDSLVREARLIAARAAREPRTDWTAAIARLAAIEDVLFRSRPGSGGHLSVLSRLTGAMTGAARYDEAEAINARALTLCPGAGDRFCNAAEIRQSDILWNKGRIPESTAMKDDLWRRPGLEESMPAGEYAVLMQRYAQALEAAGRHDEAIVLVDRILEWHDRFHDRPTGTSLRTLGRKAMLQYQLDQLDDALRTIDQAIATAGSEVGEHAPSTHDLREIRIRILLRIGRKDEAYAELNDLLPAMRESRGENHPRVLSLSRQLATHLVEQDRVPEAIVLLRDLVDRMAKVKSADSRGVGDLRLMRARLLLRSGEVEAADAEYLAALPAYLAQDGADTADSLVLQSERGMIQAQLGRPEEASRLVLGALDALRKDHPGTSNYVTVLTRAINGKCKGPDQQACATLKAEGRGVIARDLPAHRRLLPGLAKAVDP